MTRTGLPHTEQALEDFALNALEIFHRTARIHAPNARQTEIRELMLLLAQGGDSPE